MTLRVGFVGHGWVNREVWGPRAANDQRCEVVGVCDPRLAGSEVAGVRAVASVEELLLDRPDLVVVAPPNRWHHAAAADLLNHGVAVFLEKPACLTTAELDDLQARATDRGTHLLIGRPACQRNDVALLRRWVRAHGCGPLEISVEWLRRNGIPAPGTWFTRRAEAGGGALLDLGWHLADVALDLVNESAEVTEVTCRLFPAPADCAVSVSASWRGPSADASGTVDVEVDGLLGAGLSDGSTLGLRASWLTDVPVDRTTVTVAGHDSSGMPVTAALVSTFGFSSSRVDQPGVRFEDRTGVRWVPTTAPVGAEYDAQWAEIVLSVGSGVTLERPARRSREVMCLLERAYEYAGQPLGEVGALC